MGYDIENLRDPKRSNAYAGAVTTDRYGRKVPKHAHGTGNIGKHTSSTRLIIDTAMEVYDRIMDKNLLVRLKRIDRARRAIILADGRFIPVEDIVELEGPAFRHLELD